MQPERLAGWASTALALQGLAGNRAVTRLLSCERPFPQGAALQAQHRVGPADDPAKREFDFSHGRVNRDAEAAELTHVVQQTAHGQFVQRVDLSNVTATSKQLVRAYRQDSMTSGTWGGQSDLVAMAKYLRVTIHVLNFSENPSQYETSRVNTFPGGAGAREVYLRYTGNHYDVLIPGRGLFTETGKNIKFGLWPIDGDGNCLFAAVWVAAQKEATAAYRLQYPGGRAPTDANEGQQYLRRFCHEGEEPLVPSSDVLIEIAAMDSEHVGANLRALTSPPKQPKGSRKGASAKQRSGKGTKSTVLTAEEAKARLKGFKNAPAYWSTLPWTAVTSRVMKADLDSSSDLFKQIQASISHGIEKQPYTSPKGENTRMDVVRRAVEDLENKQKSTGLDAGQQQRLTALKARLTEPKGGVKPPRSRPVEIKRIEVIANETLWNAYQAAWGAVKDDLSKRKDTSPLRKVRFAGSKDQLLDKTTGEARLFHSTSPQIIDLIERGGFNPVYSANKAKPGHQPRYGPLGQGTYFADVLSKAMTYAQCPVCSDYDCHQHRDQLVQTLLSRVVLGHTKKAHAYLQPGDLRADDLSTLKTGRHSVYSEGWAQTHNAFTAASGLNEYAVREAAQTYPEFRIYYMPEPK